ncbi:MAG TPA: hypothetical protein VM938_01870 [Acidimicrobiales bacterium]|nr:hypothetical protein [Acidimicrobiales bacterium]
MIGLVLSVPLVSDIATPPARAAEDESVVRFRYWKPANLDDVLASQLHLKTASQQRLLYGLLPSYGEVVMYNLDSLEPITVRTAIGAPDASTVDPATGDLVAAFAGPGGSSIRVFRLTGTTVAEQARVDLATTLPASQRVFTVALADQGRRAFLLSMVDPVYQPSSGYETASAQAGTVTITSVDLVNRRGEWSEAVPGCSLPVTANTAPGLGYVAETNSVYFGCTAPNAQVVKYPPVPTGVGRLVLGTTRTFELFPRAGDYLNTDSVFDPGSGRLLLASSTSGAGVSVYAFDGRSNSWVGSIAVGDSIGQIGIDAEHGRLYTLSAGGLLAADTRSTPVSQGRASPSFSNDKLGPAQKRHIAVDERTGRVFLGYVQDEILVAEDRAPHFVPPRAPDADANTKQVDERPGVTGANYGGAAQAFGARYRFVGGYDSLRFNVVPVDINQQVVPLGPGTREISGAPARSIGLRNEGADASASGGERDVSNTGKDLQQGGAEWPFREARCIDLGDKPVSVSEPGASVECEAGSKATASASSGQSQLSGPGLAVGLGSSNTTSDVRIDGDRGVVSTVTANASGISILGGVLKFGGVEVTATAQAHGRAGTAKSTFTRRVRDVSMNGQRLCSEQCDEEAVARAINASFVGVLRVDFPRPDPGKLGSPGGYEAVVRIRPEEHLEAVSLNEQGDDRIEVPGMVVSLVSDNTRPSRTIFQFAGAAVEARYGIYLLGSGGGELDSPGSLGGSATDAAGLDVALDAFLGGGNPNGTTPLGAAPISDDDDPPRGLAALGWAYLRNALPETIALLLVWSILLAPVYLSARRRMLLERSVLSPGVGA